jgi:hypothetical protein
LRASDVETLTIGSIHDISAKVRSEYNAISTWAFASRMIVLKYSSTHHPAKNIEHSSTFPAAFGMN